jgi:hypothetical protein
VKVQIKPATAATCTYVEQGRACHANAVGELRGHYYIQQNDGNGWPMCARHIKPEMHPPDLHGKLFHWTLIRSTSPRR